MITLEQLTKDFDRAQRKRSGYTLDAQISQTSVHNLKIRLEKERQSIILSHPDPKTMGGNEAAREAFLQNGTQGTLEALREAQAELAVYENLLALEVLNWEHLLVQLRILELVGRPGLGQIPDLGAVSNTDGMGGL
jgi:hypothetical protein